MVRTRAARRSTKAPGVREVLKREVPSRGSSLLSRRFQVRPKDESRDRRLGFKYVVAVFGEWRGSSYYLCAKYRTPKGNPQEDFVVRQTRLNYSGLGRFDLAYFGHTNRWQPVYSGLTPQQCFETIEQEESFRPIT